MLVGPAGFAALLEQHPQRGTRRMGRHDIALRRHHLDEEEGAGEGDHEVLLTLLQRLVSVDEWLELGEGRSPYCPSDPEAHYRAAGTWISWKAFLTGQL